MQEEFLYRCYVTDALGTFIYGDNGKRWSEAVMFLHEKENTIQEEEIDVEERKSDFIKRFNEAMKK